MNQATLPSNRVLAQNPQKQGKEFSTEAVKLMDPLFLMSRYI